VSEREILHLMRQSAGRWAKEHGSHWISQLSASTDGSVLAAVTQDISDQGWLPSSLDEWGDCPALILCHLGQVLAQEAPSLFLPILTNWIGLNLIHFPPQLGASEGAGPMAASPYIDYSQTKATVFASPKGRDWVLDGSVHWVINAQAGSQLAVVAKVPSGATALFRIRLPHPGCMLSEPLVVLGLWGWPVCHIKLSSAVAGEESLVAVDQEARKRLDEGYRVARWGTLGMLSGLSDYLLEQAKAYALVRIQGGRRIIDHPPVRQLIDTAQGAVESIHRWVAHLELHPDADFSLAEMRREGLRATDNALQVFGGNGYICPGLPERCWRDVRQTATLCSDRGA
jgi:alkylation response protein AidB-like acyl-CoA dehydrogenase